MRKSYRLAHGADGYCVFFTAQRRCRIHEEHGADAKPLACRMFPMQLVPLGEFSHLIVRRSCPSAAADDGRPVKKHQSGVLRLADEGLMASRPTMPPAIAGRYGRPWQDTLRVTDALERLLLDDRFPPVRRLVHGLQFCRLLEECRLQQLDSQRFGSLIPILESSAVEEAGAYFADRRAPSASAAGMFRQTVFEYMRLEPGGGVSSSWRARFRRFRDAIAFARGKGNIARRQADLPQTTFEALERPLGPSDIETARVIGTYFEIAAASKHYAVLGRRQWPLVDSFRALAMAFPVAMWLLRLYGSERTPTVRDAIRAVGVIERGQYYDPLCGTEHRQRVRAVARGGQMSRLVAWYAR